MKITEQEQRTLDTAKRLRVTVATKGWEDIVAYVLYRIKDLKNTLAKMDLVTQAGLASQKQGEIKGLSSILNRVNNVIVEAEKIESDRAKEKINKEK